MNESDSAEPYSGNEKSLTYVPEAKSTVRLVVGGMTCVACARAIVDAVSELEGVSDISVNQVGKSASAVVTRADLVKSIVNLIEDIGYECKVISVTPIVASGPVDKSRIVAVEFAGMKSLSVAAYPLKFFFLSWPDWPDRPMKIRDILDKFESNVTILEPYTSDPPNVLRINYVPSTPHFTIRTIISTISTATSTPLSTLSVWHPPLSDEVARQTYKNEQRKLLFHIIVAIIAAIPTTVIGIVYMSILKADNPGRLYFERLAVWGLPRGEWALLIISTPVMFYSAEVN